MKSANYDATFLCLDRIANIEATCLILVGQHFHPPCQLGSMLLSISQLVEDTVR